MTHKPIIALAAYTLLVTCMAIRAGGQEKGLDSLRAFHTRTSPSPVGHIGKYEDLVVALGATNRLEFLRANGYQPQWRTADGVHRVEHAVPKTKEDPDGHYSYVRLIESGPEKVVVQWRHFRDIEAITMANDALDPIPTAGSSGRSAKRRTRATRIGSIPGWRPGKPSI
jgi:hypothetical protein